MVCRKFKIFISSFSCTYSYETISHMNEMKAESPSTWYSKYIPIISKLGCPPKLPSVISSFHNNMKGTVNYDGATSVPFDIHSGVKQGCVLAPTLFSIFFPMMLSYAFNTSTEGVFLHTRADGKLFNLARLRDYLAYSSPWCYHMPLIHQRRVSSCILEPTVSCLTLPGWEPKQKWDMSSSEKCFSQMMLHWWLIQWKTCSSW